MASVQERVQRGVNLLARRTGDPEWFRRINLNRLDMSSCVKCIVGQLYDDYDDAALSKLGIEKDDKEQIACGFMADGEDLKGAAYDFRALTAEWKSVIGKLQAA